MPTYDFICNSCTKRFDIFLTFNEYGKVPVHCTHCNSADVRRRMTKVRIAKTQDQRYESMANEFESFDGLDGDPRALGEMMKKMGREAGDDLPAEFDEVVDRLEAGQTPEEIEANMPELGSDSASNSDE